LGWASLQRLYIPSTLVSQVFISKFKGSTGSNDRQWGKYGGIYGFSF
jgi:hypothetical protein